MKKDIIQIKDLSFSYAKKNKVLNRININVPKGAIYGFLGLNGAGKSTTMQLLTGVLINDKNNIAVFGKALQSQFPEIFSKLGALVESPSLYLHLSGEDNLRCVTKLKEVSEEKIPEVLALVGLSANGTQKVKSYSLGMKQRLAIAMTLLGDPELLLLDEPVNGLDPTGMTEIRELLMKLNQEKGITIFISSHLLDEIEKMCTHIGIIHKGEMQFEGTINELSDKAGKCKIQVQTTHLENHIEVLKKEYPSITMINDNSFTLSLAGKEEIPVFSKFLIENKLDLYELKIIDGLENWFLSLTN